MKAAIIGASGYIGETLVKLFTRHPEVELAMVTSRSLAGKAVGDVIPHIRGQFPGLSFTKSSPEDLVSADDIDIFFLALPHGVSFEYAIPLAEAGKTIIDVSADFRLNSPEIYETYYGEKHPHPEWLARSSYVLPELMVDNNWRQSRILACPGCYPTSILVPLVPLLRSKVLSGQNIVINSMSGISGAGKKLKETFLYCERNESAVAYGAPLHRHLSEIEEQLTEAAGNTITVQFTPHLAPMHRGIATTIVAPAGQSTLEDLYGSWEDVFAQSPFVQLLPTGTYPDTAHVSGTNRCDISAVYDSRTNNFVITSVVDNLVKGAGGQAIQIMNLVTGMPETAGLC